MPFFEFKFSIFYILIGVSDAFVDNLNYCYDPSICDEYALLLHVIIYLAANRVCYL